MSADYVGAPDAAGDFILRDVTVVDVTDGSHAGGQDVRVSGGTISAIGLAGQDTTGLPVVDGHGAFAVPGYVDCHAHALNNPGTAPGSYALMLGASRRPSSPRCPRRPARRCALTGRPSSG
jgi:adenine deaminase